MGTIVMLSFLRKSQEKIKKRVAEKRTGDNLRASSETARTKRSRKRANRVRKRRCLIVELYDSNGLLNHLDDLRVNFFERKLNIKI
ncbi:hypothetical protein LNTAR_08291 [Lentisphaera araneosa HTCC2155]|uniref:Uncharacterized protein n=1 Tax=Lentisphaera araneosa HTCC2155 TaxID=313628 RepID=A6DS32_9BACT|nr:hypothetical protein LNTAR_08291 [Lentisphaera araneosa HTCC2155]